MFMTPIDATDAVDGVSLPRGRPSEKEPSLRFVTSIEGVDVDEARSLFDRGRARLQGMPRGQLIFDAVSDVVEVGVVDRAMTLAAQAFTSLVPVMIAIGTLGAMDPVSEALRTEYGLNLADLDASGDSSTTSFGVVGVLMLVISATSYARALGRTYGHIWAAPNLSFRQGWRWVVVIFATAFGAVAIAAARALTIVPVAGHVLTWIVQFVTWAVVWTAVLGLLTGSAVPPRARWCSGVATGAGLTALEIGSALALPRIMQSAQSQFGLLGMVFTIIGWLFVFSSIVVVAATVVRSVAASEGTWSTWLNHGR